MSIVRPCDLDLAWPVTHFVGTYTKCNLWHYVF